jgi:predicted MFS family arabinose efflux permease
VTGHFKWLLLASLYFSQGLPFGFFTQALPVLLREGGASLSRIGLSGLLFLPWALKWLWEPWVDASATRRGWIIPLQLATIVTALLLAGVDGSPADRLFWLKLAIVLCALFAATQDVPTDALAVNLLHPRERGLGNAVQVGGYRLGMVIGGGVLMIVLDQLGWAAAFVAMAVFLALTLLPVLRFSEAQMLAARPTMTRPNPLAGIWMRLTRPGMTALLLCLVAYKFGDAMASAMAKPYLVDQGFSKSAIGFWAGVVGSAGGLLGALLGGLASDRLGRRRALLLCGVAQTLAVTLYAVHAAGVGGTAWLKAAVGLEHLLGGMATVALFTLMMDASEPAHAGTDYTLQASAVVIATGLASACGGLLGDALGYAGLFAVSAGLSGVGCAVLLWALQRGRAPVVPYWQSETGAGSATP